LAYQGEGQPANKWQALIYYTPIIENVITLTLVWAFVTGFGKRPLLNQLGWAHISRTRRIPLRGRKFPLPFPAILGGLLAGVGLYFCTLALLWWKPSPPTPLDEMFKTSSHVRLMFSLTSVACAPFVEELLYRGLIWCAYERTWGRVAATAASTVTFVLVHLSQYKGSAVAIVIIGALGLMCATARAWADSLSAAYSVHLAYNTCVAVYLVFFYTTS
jgi:membrane protease YdiL (CAAX protease family)